MKRFLPLLLALVALVGLSGCVRYDLGISYVSQTRGEIVQRIRLGESVTHFDGTIAQDWIHSLEQRTKELGGKTQRRSRQDVLLRIPFHNGAELTEKFNRFFAPVVAMGNGGAAEEDPDTLPQILSHLSLEEQNWLLVQRNRLSYDLDLRSLSVLGADGTVMVSPGALLELDFSLDTPWGAQVLPGSVPPQGTLGGRHLTWSFNAIEASHLEVVFWVPSPLGIGTGVIGLLVLAGAALKATVPSLSPGQTPAVR